MCIYVFMLDMFTQIGILSYLFLYFKHDNRLASCIDNYVECYVHFIAVHFLNYYKFCIQLFLLIIIHTNNLN